MRFEIAKAPKDYQEIWKWLNIFHRRSFYSTGLMGDFAQDIWMSLQGKTYNNWYLMKKCRLYPIDAIRRIYSEFDRSGQRREIVMLNEDGSYIDHLSNDPEFELTAAPVPKKTNNYKKGRPVRVTYRNGEVGYFDSTRELAKSVDCHIESIRKRVGMELTTRYTNRKLSHIKLIEWV